MIRTTKEQKLTNTRRDLRETENFASEENFTRMFDAVVVSHLKMGTWRSDLSDPTQPRRFVVHVSSAASEEEEEEELSKRLWSGTSGVETSSSSSSGRLLELCRCSLSIQSTGLCGGGGPTLTRLFLFVHLCLSPDEAPWIRLSTACSPGRVITPDLRHRVTPSRRPIITPTTSRDPRTPATHPDSLTPGRATPEPWTLATTPTKGRVGVFAGLPKEKRSIPWLQFLVNWSFRYHSSGSCSSESPNLIFF